MTFDSTPEALLPSTYRIMRTSCILAGLLTIAFATSACDTTEVTPEEWIEPEEALPDIEQLVGTFLDEAEARDATETLFTPSNLRIEVMDTLRRDGGELCGYGQYFPAEDEPLIQVATNRRCWDRPGTDREILVFHELGHALLGRGHRDDQLPNGLRASIMDSGNIFGLYSETRAHWRPYYVDELFDPNTEPPDWAYEPASH